MFQSSAIKNALGSTFDRYREFQPEIVNFAANSAEGTLLENRSRGGIVAKSASVIIPQFTVQRVIRPIYGKVGINEPDIGDHPDFRYLAETGEEVYSPITTLFIDIAGSTRLSRLRPLPEVKRIKNAFMSAAIEIAQAFDGHVHRLQGDSVMAYFGGVDRPPENGVIDALNCASMIRYFVDKIVIPKLKEEGFDDPPGIRIGLDFGAKDDVLWGCYGYPGTCEVTATSFYVDVASKLQHSAGKNQIMIGESLRSFLDLPENILSDKTVVRNGTSEKELFVLPNHCDEKGNPFDYRQHIFEWERYLSYSPIAQADTDYVIGCTASGIMRVTAETSAGAVVNPYFPASQLITKGNDIRFGIQLPYMPKLPYTLRFIVENHGAEARTRGGLTLGNHESEIHVQTQQEHENLSHWETAEYRGLHYMIARLSTAAGLQHETRFGVFVE